MTSARPGPVSLTDVLAPGWLGHVRLRRLVATVTVAAMLPFIALAALHPRGAAVALAGALLVAAHGLFWLLLLRRKRAWLRGHGLRW